MAHSDGATPRQAVAAERQAANRLRFTGREFDPETGLYYLRARYYDPGTGRFLWPDPPGQSAGPNLYAYADGNPLLFVDPLGLDFTAHDVAEGIDRSWEGLEHNAVRLGANMRGRGPLGALAGFSLLFGATLSGAVRVLSPHHLLDLGTGGGTSLTNLQNANAFLGPNPKFGAAARFYGENIVVGLLDAVAIVGTGAGAIGAGVRGVRAIKAAGKGGSRVNLPKIAGTSSGAVPGGGGGGVAGGGPLGAGGGGAVQLGDLTAQEIEQIQAVVIRAGRPLDVVGSAARGTRRGIGTNLPIGKGPGTRSDIDYLVPGDSLRRFFALESRLPSVDRATGVLSGRHNPLVGPAIRFDPFSPPRFIPRAE